MKYGILQAVGIALLALVWLSEAGAQTKLRDLIAKRSDPSAAMTKAVNGASLFSPDVLRALDLRSLMAAPEAARLAGHSDFSDADLAALTARSDFTDAEMRLLEKQTEPDTSLILHMDRDAQPAPGMIKRDHLLDPAMMAVLLRLSTLAPDDRARMSRTVDPAQSAPAIQRNSINAPDAARRLANDALPPADLLRLLQRRSFD